MSERRDDRRVRRTRRQLRDALVALVLRKGWDQVSVLDVCDQADVGRSTFYAHFADKEDLLLSGFDDLHQSLAGGPAEAREPFGFVEPLLVHASANLDLYRAVAGREAGLPTSRQIEWRLRDVIHTLIDAELGALEVPKATRGPAARFVAGGLTELLMEWVERGKPSGAAELARSFRTFALAVVRAR